MKKALFGSMLAAAFTAAAANYSFKGTTDKNPLEYTAGDTMAFTLTLVDKDAANATVTDLAGKNLELRWTLAGDQGVLDGDTTLSGTTTTNPFTVNALPKAPGFVRLTVNIYANGVKLAEKTEKFDGGAGCDIRNMQEWPAPADFASFWNTATNSLYSMPFSGSYAGLCTNFVPANAAAGVEYYLFEFPMPNDSRPSTGILAKPEGADSASCGLICTFDGYGFGPSALPNAANVLKGNIVMIVARHGEYPLAEQAYYDALQAGEMKSFCFRNNDLAVQDTDFYKMIMRDLRALQYAKSLPIWDGEHISLSGGSMGGYRTIAATALCSGVTSCTVSIPWCQDLSSVAKYGRMNGWRPDYTANLDYVEGKNFANLITCPVTFSARLGDYVCPPSGEILLYRNLPEPKKATFYQNGGHDGDYGVASPSYVLQDPEPEPEPEVIPRALKWVGSNGGKWNVAANWMDQAGGTNTVPRSGDVLDIGDAQSIINDIPDLWLKQIKTSGYQSNSSGSQQTIILDAATSDGIYNTGYLHYDFPTALVGTNVTLYSSSTFVCRTKLCSQDGNPCGVVKTGTGRAGFNGEKGSYTGFRYVSIAEGEWIYGINSCTGGPGWLDDGQTITFDGVGASLGISANCVFSNGWIRETSVALNKTHTISCQVDNGDVKRGKLTLCGTPPVDSMVFTGTFETSVDFCWDPASAAKEFVVSGKTSTTTGNVEVLNGTLRLTNGAGYSKIGILTVRGANSAFVVDTAPNNAFNVKSLVVGNGGKLNLASGVTIAADGLTLNGVRMTPGTYTAANASTWIVGAGSVVVKGVTNAQLDWVKGITPKNFSNPNAWTNQTTGLNDVPVNGDTLNLLRMDNNDNKNNDLVGLEPYKIIIPTGYQSVSGNSVTFRKGSYGVYSDGYMYYDLPTYFEGCDFTIYCSSFTGWRQGMMSYVPGERIGFTKTGKDGQLSIQPNTSAARWAGLKYINLQQGSVSIGGQGVGTIAYLPEGIEVTFCGSNNSDNMRLDFEKYAALTNFCLRETATAVTNKHYIGTKESNNTLRYGALEIVGKPPVDDMVFHGYFADALDFVWNPTDAAKTFTLAGALANCTTTNKLIVKNGTVRLTEGATFTRLLTVQLEGGEGTAFKVDTLPAPAFHATNLVLVTGLEKVQVYGGVKIAFDAVSVNGVGLPAAVYTSQSNMGGTRVDWIEGAGYVCVGGADITFPAPPASTVAVSWTAGGGADTSISNAANWGGTLPNLTDGSLDATFAVGTGAALDRMGAAFNSLTLNAPGVWDFTNPNENYFAYLGAGGLTTVGTGKTYTYRWPTMLLQPQTWTIAGSDKLVVNAALAGTSKLVIEGANSTVDFNVPSGFAGTIVASNKTVNANADDCFGASAVNAIEVNPDKTALWLNGVTVNRPIRNINTAGGGVVVNCKASTTNVVDGNIYISTPQKGGKISMGTNSYLRVKGDIIHETTEWAFFVGSGNSTQRGDLHVDGRIWINGGAAYGTDGNGLNLYLNSPSNNFGGVWFWYNKDNQTLFTTVPYAFAAGMNGQSQKLNMWGAGSNQKVDLCGNDQSLDGFGSSDGEITSATPATLHDIDNNKQFSWQATNRCVFTQAASFSFEGSKETRLEGVSTSTGTVQVTKGELILGTTGSWRNATTAIVKGGKMTIEHEGAFGKTTDLDLSSAGTLNLVYSGAMRVHALKLDDVELPMGVYGASDNTSVNSANRLASITGTGTINVIGDGLGLMLIFR
jgi:cephalosporin-C deacetylase-like acetyl esterase